MAFPWTKKTSRKRKRRSLRPFEFPANGHLCLGESVPPQMIAVVGQEFFEPLGLFLTENPRHLDS